MHSREFRNSPGYENGPGDTFSTPSMMQNNQKRDDIFGGPSQGSWNGTDFGAPKSFGKQGASHKQDCHFFNLEDGDQRHQDAANEIERTTGHFETVMAGSLGSPSSMPAGVLTSEKKREFISQVRSGSSHSSILTNPNGN